MVGEAGPHVRNDQGGQARLPHLQVEAQGCGRQPHWHTITAGRDHLGWQRWPGDRSGRWLLRRRRGGRYVTEPLGMADDALPSDGISVLSFDQARALAVELASREERRPARLTVSRAMANYVDHLRAEGRDPGIVETCAVNYVIPKLGDVEVASLTSQRIRQWLAEVASTPARGKPAPESDDEVRRRRSSANRMLTILKSALNLAYDERLVESNDAWGRRVKRFAGVGQARIRFLSSAEAVRFLSGCEEEFRPLARAALETGCRYSELSRLEVADFDPDSMTLLIRRSKTNRPRRVWLTDDPAKFFALICSGRSGSDLMFTRKDGRAWRPSNQSRYVAEANQRASIVPPITFHGLRHTWASLAVMAGVPIPVVAKNLGHATTAMVEKHYGHIAASFVSESIRTKAPRFDVT